MDDPRAALRAVYGRWLRLRASVRAMRAKVLAAEHVLARDARRNPGPDMAALEARLVQERGGLESLGRELDARIAEVARERAALEPAGRATVIAAAKKRRFTLLLTISSPRRRLHAGCGRPPHGENDE